MANVFRVRYAPSPTGHLHIGGARTALLNYLFARKHGGQFVIRFEDTDQTRHMESGIESQLEGLRWLGLDWDESVDVGGPYAPYRQTERLPLYRPFIERLLSSGHAYRCYCTEEELERERAEQEARGEMIKYTGRCRHLSPEQEEAFRAEGRVPSIRFRVPEGRTITFEDRVRGRVEFESDGIGDFIIVRPDGIPTYNFAVVLDDHLMRITHVIRGEEHLSNTPRQLLIYEALGVPAPEFAHLALILNQDRKKMSKRDESIVQFIEQYRELGYLPEALINFIALLGWSPKGEEEILPKEQLIEQFDLDRVQKSPAVFDTDKLNWMNNHYLKQVDIGRMIDLALPHLQREGRLPRELPPEQRAWAEQLIALYRDQMRYAAEIVTLSDLFFREEVELDAESAALLGEPHVPVVLEAFLRQVDGMDAYAEDGIQAALKQVQKETGYKGKQLFMTIRVALTGQQHGPDLVKTIFLLGRQKVASRLRERLSRLS